MEVSLVPLGGAFWPPGALRGPLETDCGPLNGPWSLQGHSCACPGPPLGPPGRPLGRSWRLLGLSWAAPGRSWRLLGGPRGALGASRAALGALWAAPKSLSAQKPKFVDSIAFFLVFWGSGRPPGTSWGSLGALLAAPGALLAALGWFLGQPKWWWVALGCSWARTSGSWVLFALLLGRPWAQPASAHVRKPPTTVRFYCIDSLGCLV